MKNNIDMGKLLLIILIAAVIFIAGCQQGITGRAVLDQDKDTAPSQETTTSIFFQYEENKKSCENGVWRKQILANGSVKEYCNRILLERKKCDLDGRCGNYEECFNGYCRPI